MSRESMISSQLIARGIDDDRILDAFSAVDREDFVLLQNKRNAYSDIELPVGENKVLIRAFVLAKIIEKALEYPCENVLIVGDSTGYTSMIFKCLFKNVTLGTFRNSEIETFRSKIDSVKVSLVDDLRCPFDLIFFDSGVYENKTIKNTRKLLTPEGILIYFYRSPSFEFTPQQFDFFDVSVVFEKERDREVILQMPLWFPSDIVW